MMMREPKVFGPCRTNVVVLFPRASKVELTAYKELDTLTCPVAPEPKNWLAPVTCKVDEAWSAPLTVRAALTVDEAVERKPPYNVAKPLACRVDEAWKTSVTVRAAPTDEDAVELNPP